MAEVTGTQDREAEQKDPRFKAAREAGNGETGRENLEHAAQGADLNGAEEKSALDWLLGDPVPLEHTIPVDFETPRGMVKLTFLSKRIDPKRIDTIEAENLMASGRVDRLTADIQIVAESCYAVTDASGEVKQLNSDSFRTMNVRNPSGNIEELKLASKAMALEKRFVGQEGVLTLVAAEIRRLAGYDTSRLGQSQRRLVEGSLG